MILLFFHGFVVLNYGEKNLLAELIVVMCQVQNDGLMMRNQARIGSLNELNKKLLKPRFFDAS